MSVMGCISSSLVLGISFQSTTPLHRTPSTSKHVCGGCPKKQVHGFGTERFILLNSNHDSS